MTRRGFVAVAFAFVVIAASGCGRELPAAEETAPEGGDVTSEFGEPEAADGALQLAGAPAGVRLAEASARGFRRDEPRAEIATTEDSVSEALTALCRGTLDIAAADRSLTAAERKACTGTAEGAVELPVASDAGKPVVLVTTQKVLFDSLEAEAFLDYVIANNEQVAKQAGVEPLTVDELQATQTEFEQALAGV